jgi:ADP-ribose pyrophosphatase
MMNVCGVGARGSSVFSLGGSVHTKACVRNFYNSGARPKIGSVTYAGLSRKQSTMSKGSPFDAKINSVEHLTDGKWIQTRKIKYQDPTGKSREWEMAVRTTRSEQTNIDAVLILALLKYPSAENKPAEVVLTKQFRPPTELVVVELPAGLIDPNESVQLTATRELLEETGYHGKFVNLSSTQHIGIFSDPGLTNANMDLAVVDVDMTVEANRNPKPQLEDGEFIDVVTVPVADLIGELHRLSREEGCVIDARLYHLAVGLDIGINLTNL